MPGNRSPPPKNIKKSKKLSTTLLTGIRLGILDEELNIGNSNRTSTRKRATRKNPIHKIFKIRGTPKNKVLQGGRQGFTKDLTAFTSTLGAGGRTENRTDAGGTGDGADAGGTWSGRHDGSGPGSSEATEETSGTTGSEETETGSDDTGRDGPRPEHTHGPRDRAASSAGTDPRGGRYEANDQTDDIQNI